MGNLEYCKIKYIINNTKKKGINIMEKLRCDFCSSTKNTKEKLFTFSMVYYNICKICEDKKLVEKEHEEYLKEL